MRTNGVFTIGFIIGLLLWIAAVLIGWVRG